MYPIRVAASKMQQQQSRQSGGFSSVNLCELVEIHLSDSKVRRLTPKLAVRGVWLSPTAEYVAFDVSEASARTEVSISMWCR